MNRLTKLDGIGQYDLIRCFECSTEKSGDNLEHCGYCEDGWRAAIDRLAAYEDTGLEPEAIKKCFNEDAMMKLAAQYLGVTPDRLRELVEADSKMRVNDLYDEDGGEILKGGHHEAADNK